VARVAIPSYVKAAGYIISGSPHGGDDVPMSSPKRHLLAVPTNHDS
jgi:hypothetical protein